ncbi:MAG: hypothetical protein JW969_07170 [Spirochaetales bacterium]|nr:hypothetical protein [Spirochaetales bacterium]
MPILPIDLQTLFSSMNQVGKEQAIQKEIAPEQQSIQANEMAKRTQEKDNSVNETEEMDNGPEKLKEDEEKKNQEKMKGKKKKSEKKNSNENKDDPFKDPDLGQHIDIVR